ncbi:MAG: hypothetical protein OXF73_04960 [Gammaproteobacteria bacterium]|nr:hypothetical protein [Gammaproteobacteria bacterium]MCY4227088.1 hypothetical protein [Gammaproteobacteria bacterium]
MRKQAIRASLKEIGYRIMLFDNLSHLTENHGLYDTEKTDMHEAPIEPVDLASPD